MGVPIIRIIVFWGLYWGTPILGNYHIRRFRLERVKPGWRRAKSFDNFHQRVPQIQEALFLDDPSRSKTSVADLKSFAAVDEDSTCDGCYNEPRLARNRMRALASNNLGDDPILSPDTCDVVILVELFQVACMAKEETRSPTTCQV